MKPVTRRRILLASLVILSAWAAFGCADFAHGHRWVHDASMPDCPKVTWVQVARDATPGLCIGRDGAAAPGTSCVLGCVVVSPYSEQQAKALDVWGISLYAHEVDWHIRRKLRHPNE